MEHDVSILMLLENTWDKFELKIVKNIMHFYFHIIKEAKEFYAWNDIGRVIPYANSVYFE